VHNHYPAGGPGNKEHNSVNYLEPNISAHVNPAQSRTHVATTTTGLIQIQSLPSPSDIGLPGKFKEFRPEQLMAYSVLSGSEVKFQLLNMGTGTGKSLSYFNYAYLSGKRTVILTSTKGLQKQAMDDFGACGLVDIRGRSNYTCQLHPSLNCEVGHHSKCPYDKGPQCEYSYAVERARNAQYVVTNYKYFMLMLKHSREGAGLGDFDLMLCDEGHSIEQEVCSAASKEVTDHQVRTMLQTDPVTRMTVPGIAAWAEKHLPIAQAQAERMEAMLQSGQTRGEVVKMFLEWRALADTLKDLCGDLQGQWAVYRNGKSIVVEPLWAAGFCETMLFRAAKQVGILSATLVPKTGHLLGLHSDNYDYLEIPSPFPIKRAPIYYIPTVKVSKGMTDGDTVKWLSRIREIIATRYDRQGIVHSVSHPRTLNIVDALQNPRLIFNESAHSTASVVQIFKSETGGDIPNVLVSPSVTTGYDFPYDECEFQIVCKLPFAEQTNPIVQQRSMLDKTYTAYTVAQKITQMVGRGMRHHDDACETFIIDDNISWFLSRNIGRPYFPQSFLRAYQRRMNLPPLPPKLTGKRQHRDG
jgi:ATP-dependent DNA helicase DinG